jgi:hypothetical protein
MNITSIIGLLAKAFVCGLVSCACFFLPNNERESTTSGGAIQLDVEIEDGPVFDTG